MRWMVLAGCLAAAGCGPDEAARDDSAAVAPVDWAVVAAAPVAAGAIAANLPSADLLNPVSRKLLAVAPAEQLAALQLVVTSAGEACASVADFGFYASYAGEDMWRATCPDSGDWLVSLAGDGSTKVLDCKAAGALGIDCRKPE